MDPDAHVFNLKEKKLLQRERLKVQGTRIETLRLIKGQFCCSVIVVAQSIQITDALYFSCSHINNCLMVFLRTLQQS